jgi:hypothetical protein
MPVVRVFQAAMVADVVAADFVSAELKAKVNALIADKLQQALEQIETELSTPGFSLGIIFNENVF